MSNDINNQNNNNAPNKKSHGCLISIITIVICTIIFFAVIFIIDYNKNNGNNGTNNWGGNSTPSLLSRRATLNDLTVSGDDLDLSSFGEKLTFTPNKDIDGLKLKFIFQKSNGTQLQTIEKSVGNVKEGQQYSVTISIFELSWDVIKNTADLECKYTVSAGTVSYFA